MPAKNLFYLLRTVIAISIALVDVTFLKAMDEVVLPPVAASGPSQSESETRYIRLYAMPTDVEGVWRSGCEQVNPGRDIKDWHEGQKNKLQGVGQTIANLKPGRNPNIATFRIKVCISDSVIAEFESGTFFISGGYGDNLDDLRCSMQGSSFVSIAETCPEIANKSYDYSLREAIATFFDLEDRLDTEAKESMLKDFQKSLGKPLTNISVELGGELEPGEKVKLKEAVSRFLNDTIRKDFANRQDIRDTIYRSTLDWRFFKPESSQKLEAILGNKCFIKKKGGITSCTVHEAFDGDFQLNFSDSEQSIRLFIYGLNLNNKWFFSPEMNAWFEKKLFIFSKEYISKFQELEKLKKDEAQSTQEFLKVIQIASQRIASISSSIRTKESLLKRLNSDLDELQKVNLRTEELQEIIKKEMQKIKNDLTFEKAEKVELENESKKHIEGKDVFLKQMLLLKQKREEQIIEKDKEVVNLFKGFLTELTNASIHVDIASSQDMCQNCQTTFLWDIIVKRWIQRSVWDNIVSRAIEDLCQGSLFIKTIRDLLVRYGSNEGIFLLAPPKVSIVVSGFKRYE